MPLMNINFVIASKNPKELSGFYARINSHKDRKGFNASHYFISLSNRSKIHFYRPNENHEWQRKGNSTSLCFQHEPSEDPSKIINGKGKETQLHCVFKANLLKIQQKLLKGGHLRFCN